MGNEAHDDYAKKQAQQQPHNKYKLKILLFVIVTNIPTIYIFCGSSLNLNLTGHNNHLSLPLWDSPTLVHELNSTKFELAASHSFFVELQQQLNSTNLLVDALLIELIREHERLTQKVASVPGGKFNADLSIRLSDEMRVALGPHKLPLGKSPMTGLDEVIAPVGVGCFKLQEELVQYMTYEIGAECLVDDVFAQRLLLKGCEPLPRWRCHPKSTSELC
ncbi:uncharacterized protein LOC116112472 [Pistacia vera]|uniref:uncharacterized protein LOC116112472 n=1 Tax=Pistacia vera TaxID=55513 RepID=UPI0012638F19|nr:uncharacterized protein LOC116112472 [Pistacia vera]